MTLFRSREDVLLGGVCSGLGRYLGTNPTYVRLFFILLAVGNGIGILIYLLLWLMIPLDSQINRLDHQDRQLVGQLIFPESSGKARQNPDHSSRYDLTLFAGIALITLGFLYLVSQFHLPWLEWLDYGLIWPIILLFGGLALLFRQPRGGKSHERRNGN